PKVSLLGHFIGGWLAAEMAVVCPQMLDRLILVDVAGIQPQQGEIADIFLHGQEGTRRLVYFDPQQMPEYQELFGRKPTPEERETQGKNKEIAFGCCWHPFMYDCTLRWLLRRVPVLPLIVWGGEARIVPGGCGKLYQQAIPGPRLAVIDGWGPCPPLEKP